MLSEYEALTPNGGEDYRVARRLEVFGSKMIEILKDSLMKWSFWSRKRRAVLQLYNLRRYWELELHIRRARALSMLWKICKTYFWYRPSVSRYPPRFFEKPKKQVSWANLLFWWDLVKPEQWKNQWKIENFQNFKFCSYHHKGHLGRILKHSGCLKVDLRTQNRPILKKAS